MTLEELKEKSLVELKAIAYDLLLNQQMVNNSLETVLKEINAKTKQESTPKAEVVE